MGSAPGVGGASVAAGEGSWSRRPVYRTAAEASVLGAEAGAFLALFRGVGGSLLQGQQHVERQVVEGLGCRSLS